MIGHFAEHNFVEKSREEVSCRSWCKILFCVGENAVIGLVEIDRGLGWSL